MNNEFPRAEAPGHCKSARSGAFKCVFYGRKPRCPLISIHALDLSTYRERASLVSLRKLRENTTARGPGGDPTAAGLPKPELEYYQAPPPDAPVH